MERLTNNASEQEIEKAIQAIVDAINENPESYEEALHKTFGEEYEMAVEANEPNMLNSALGLDEIAEGLFWGALYRGENGIGKINHFLDIVKL